MQTSTMHGCFGSGLWGLATEHRRILEGGGEEEGEKEEEEEEAADW